MKRYWEVCSKISWDESNSHACGGNVRCPRWMCFLSHKHTSTLPFGSPRFARTHLVRSLWLCNDGRPVPKGGAAATVLAVGDDRGVVRAFNPHALHLPGDPLRTFGCGQMHRSRSDRMHARGTRLPADCPAENSLHGAAVWATALSTRSLCLRRHINLVCWFCPHRSFWEVENIQKSTKYNLTVHVCQSEFTLIKFCHICFIFNMYIREKLQVKFTSLPISDCISFSHNPL